MNKVISVVGGDLRIVKLVEMLIEDNYTVYTYGLEYSEELLKLDGVEMCPTLQEAVKDAKAVVGPIPLSSDRKNLSMPFSNIKLPIGDFINSLEGKTLIAGNITEPIRNMLDEKSIIYIDLLKREEFSVLNTISTAEGTIQIAMEETQKTVHDLDKHLGKFDIIINTIPFQILDNDRLDLLKKDILIIDLASNPGGVDRKSAKEKNIKLIWALSLPGKVAPVTSAEFIKETLYHALKEMN